MTALLVVLGGALGAVLRYLAAHHLDRPLRSHGGTLLVNVAGSFLLGWLTQVAPSPELAAFLGAGFCGALTTYSAVAVQAVNLRGLRGPAYATGTVLGCLAAAWLGWSIG